MSSTDQHPTAMHVAVTPRNQPTHTITGTKQPTAEEEEAAAHAQEMGKVAVHELNLLAGLIKARSGEPTSRGDNFRLNLFQDPQEEAGGTAGRRAGSGAAVQPGELSKQGSGGRQQQQELEFGAWARGPAAGRNEAYRCKARLTVEGLSLDEGAAGGAADPGGDLLELLEEAGE